MTPALYLMYGVPYRPIKALATWTAAGPIALLLNRRGKEMKADAVHWLIAGRTVPFRIALAPLRSFFQTLAEQQMLVQLVK